MTRTAPLLSLLSLSLVACGPDNGSTDADPKADTATTPSTARSTVDGMVGSDFDRAVSVRGWLVADDSMLVRDIGASAMIQSDGSFSLDTMTGAELYIVEAVDADGDRQGMAVVSSTGGADAVIKLRPIDAESTVEASAWLGLVQESSDKWSHSFADVVGRVNTELAAAVWDDGDWVDDTDADGMLSLDSNAELEVLVDALDVAQQAELMSWTSAGLSWDQHDAWDTESLALMGLSARLYYHAASADSTDDPDLARADFDQGVLLGTQLASGLSASALMDAGASSWMAFGAVISTHPDADLALAEAARLSWGQGQSERSVAVASEAFGVLNPTAGTEPQAVIDAEGRSFVASTFAAPDLTTMGDAWTSWESTLAAMPRDDQPASGGLLFQTETFADLSLLSADLMLTAAADGATTCRDTVRSAADSIVSDGVMTEVEAEALAMSAVSAWATYRDDMDTTVVDVLTDLLPGLDAATSPMAAAATTDVLVSLEGGWVADAR